MDYAQANKQADQRLYGAYGVTSPASDVESYNSKLAAEPRRTPANEAEERARYHRKEAERAERASAFFCKNPAFEEFIDLIRLGVVQI